MSSTPPSGCNGSQCLILNGYQYIARIRFTVLIVVTVAEQSTATQCQCKNEDLLKKKIISIDYLKQNVVSISKVQQCSIKNQGSGKSLYLLLLRRVVYTHTNAEGIVLVTPINDFRAINWPIPSYIRHGHNYNGHRL